VIKILSKLCLFFQPDEAGRSKCSTQKSNLSENLITSDSVIINNYKIIEKMDCPWTIEVNSIIHKDQPFKITIHKDKNGRDLLVSISLLSNFYSIGGCIGWYFLSIQDPVSKLEQSIVLLLFTIIKL
jgi:hypothetical protein